VSVVENIKSRGVLVGLTTQSTFARNREIAFKIDGVWYWSRRGVHMKVGHSEGAVTQGGTVGGEKNEE